MRLTLLLCTLFTLSLSATLPVEFLGTWDLDHSENLNEYLTAKGYSWLTRKLVAFAKFKKEFKPAQGRKFDYANLTTKKNVYYKDVDLGKEFVGEGLDGGKHKVLFEMKGNTLYEHHHPITKGTAVDETYEYTVEPPFLVLRMKAGGVTGVRYYKKA